MSIQKKILIVIFFITLLISFNIFCNSKFYEKCTILPSTSFIYKNNKIHNLTITNNHIDQTNEELILIPQDEKINIKVNLDRPKVGLMFVGLYSSEVIAMVSIIECMKNNISWENSYGQFNTSKLGSKTLNSTFEVGYMNDNKSMCHITHTSVLPLIKAESIIYTGWDISSKSLSYHLEDIGMFDYDLTKQLSAIFKGINSLPTIVTPQFQFGIIKDTNIISGTSSQQLETIRKDIQMFKKKT